MTLFYVFLSGHCHYCQTLTIKKTIDNNATNNMVKAKLGCIVKEFILFYLFIYLQYIDWNNRGFSIRWTNRRTELRSSLPVPIVENSCLFEY